MASFTALFDACVVFFHRLGELRDRTAEDMAHRASGLNLVVNAIVLWTTTNLARAVAYVHSQGVDLTDKELSHVAPLRWDHIALTGDYLWSDVDAPREALPAPAHQSVQTRSVQDVIGRLAYTAAEPPTHPLVGA